jgi:hypothetical protein
VDLYLDAVILGDLRLVLERNLVARRLPLFHLLNHLRRCALGLALSQQTCTKNNKKQKTKNASADSGHSVRHGTMQQANGGIGFDFQIPIIFLASFVQFRA